MNPKKLKPGLIASYDLRPGNGEGLFWFRRLINLSLTYLDTYPLTYSPGTHTGRAIQKPLKISATSFHGSYLVRDTKMTMSNHYTSKHSTKQIKSLAQLIVSSSFTGLLRQEALYSISQYTIHYQETLMSGGNNLGLGAFRLEQPRVGKHKQLERVLDDVRIFDVDDGKVV